MEVVVIDMCGIYAAAVGRMLLHARLAVDPFYGDFGSTSCSWPPRWSATSVATLSARNTAAAAGPAIRVRPEEPAGQKPRTPPPRPVRKIINTLDKDPEGQQILPRLDRKERLRDLIRLRLNITATTPTPERIRHHLDELFTWCADYAHIPELLTLAQTIDRWHDPIITALLTGVSNAKSEGLNRVIYESSEYKRHYAFLDLLTPLRHMDRRVSDLDAQVLEGLQARAFDTLGLIQPEPLARA